MSSVLRDITVLDLTRQFSAALAAAFLGDFGARVIRLELLPAPPREATGRWNHEADLIHRNKQSVTIDARQPRGRELLAGLVAQADVIVTDWEREELAALGLDHAAASALRPDVVYGRLSGFGPEGPDRELPAIETAAARTGDADAAAARAAAGLHRRCAMHATAQLPSASCSLPPYVRRRRPSWTYRRLALTYGSALDLQAFLATGAASARCSRSAPSTSPTRCRVRCIRPLMGVVTLIARYRPLVADLRRHGRPCARRPAV